MNSSIVSGANEGAVMDPVVRDCPEEGNFYIQELVFITASTLNQFESVQFGCKLSGQSLLWSILKGTRKEAPEENANYGCEIEL